MNASYFSLAGIVESMWFIEQNRSTPASVKALAELTHRTEPQALTLLTDLKDLGMVAARGEHWSLSPRGRSWASDLVGFTAHAQGESKKHFQSFLDYRPHEWWPHGK